MNINTSSLNAAASDVAAKAEHVVQAAQPRLRDAAASALNVIKPALAFAAPLARRLNWRMVAVGVLAGAAGYLLRATLVPAAPRQAKSGNGKPHEINRWENEGGMVATPVPAAKSTAPKARPVDVHGDVGSGSGEPPLNS